MNRPSNHTTPVFVCGTARSGTTLLAGLLDSHPSVAVLPSETYFYRLLLDRPLSWLVLHAAELLDLPWLKAIQAHPRVAVLSLQGHRELRRKLTLWARTFPDVCPVSDSVIDEVVAENRRRSRYWLAFLDLYKRCAGLELNKKRYWIEKTPSNERFVVFSEHAFSAGARYLHLLRDPRDVAASWLLRRGVKGTAREQTLVHVCYVWSLSLSACVANVHRCGTRYHVLKYEHLVRAPRNTMVGICDFLGLDFLDDMLESTRLGRPIALNTSYAGVRSAPGAITTSQTNRHREVLSPHEIALVEGLLGPQMAACGYPAVHAPSEEMRSGRRTLSRFGRRHLPSIVKMLKLQRVHREFTGRVVADFTPDRSGDGPARPEGDRSAASQTVTTPKP